MGQVRPRPGVNGSEGQLVMRGGPLRGKKALVSGSATADALARRWRPRAASSGHRQALEDVQVALARFTAALYGRDEKLDETALDESLSDSFRVVRRLKIKNLWLLRKFKGMSQSRPKSAIGRGRRIQLMASITQRSAISYRPESLKGRRT